MYNLYYRGMLGIGDTIHQRAVIRQIKKEYPDCKIFLETFYASLNHDLDVYLVPNRNRKQLARTNEDSQFSMDTYPANNKFPWQSITYTAGLVHTYGTMLDAMYAVVGFDDGYSKPRDYNFTLQVKPEWIDAARRLLEANKTGKPVMVYRPIVLNRVWECPARAPDPVAYADIYREIRNDFFVVSVARLGKDEWVISAPSYSDLPFNHGELSMETLIGLVHIADIVFANPGFMPILAQAVGTPNIIVYGGNETYEQTNAIGSRFAPTLAIEPLVKCGCMTRYHDCDKTIDVPEALRRIEQFRGQLCRRAF